MKLSDPIPAPNSGAEGWGWTYARTDRSMDVWKFPLLLPLYKCGWALKGNALDGAEGVMSFNFSSDFNEVC